MNPGAGAGAGASANPYQTSMIYGRPSVGYEQQMYDGANRGGAPVHAPQYIYYTNRAGSIPGAVSGSIPGSIPGTVSIPQTPFDPVYGVTLLPSHLLIGSPFINTPQSGGPGSGAGSNGIMNMRNPSYKSFFPPAPKLRPAPTGRSKRSKKKNSMSQQHFYDSTGYGENNFGPESTPYGFASRPQSFSASTSGSTLGPRSRPEEFDSESMVEFRYSILPKGNDTYRSRSLLFSNVNPEVDLPEFLQTVAKNYPIESIYKINDNKCAKEVEKDINSSSENDETQEGIQQEKTTSESIEENTVRTDEVPRSSYLLSFFAKETCLDFYNNLLQRYADIKNAVKSDNLSLNFVKIQDDEDWIAQLKEKVISMGASRSLYVEFTDDGVTADSLWDTLPLLKDSAKYVVINADIVSSDERRKHFGSHYCLLHLLSVSMALEVKELLETRNKFISKTAFALPTSTSDQDTRRNSSISLRHDSNSQIFSAGSRSRSRSSNVSLPLSEHTSTVSTDLSSSNSEEFGGNLSWSTLAVDPSEYGKPPVKEYNHHLNSWILSKPAAVYMHTTGTNKISYSNLSDDVDPLSASNHETVPQQMLVNDYQYVMEPLMPPQITQTIQNQYSKSIQAVNAGMEHRTVYIGNINPRSKPEDICNVVRGGILQHVKWVSHKRICFVTFVETAAAVQFYANTTLEPIILHGNVLKVGWGQNPGPLPKNIALAVTVGASRNVYVSLPDKAFKDKFMNDPQFEEFQKKYKIPNITQLKSDFGSYGAMEQVNFHPDGHCCWINFMSISSAIKLVEEYSATKRNIFHEKTDGRYVGLIIGYGKDRCGNINKNLVFNKSNKSRNHGHNLQNNGGNRGRRQQKQTAATRSSPNGNLRHSSTSNTSLSNNKPPNSNENRKSFLSLGVDVDFAEGLGISISPRVEKGHGSSDIEDEGEEEDVEVDKEKGVTDALETSGNEVDHTKIMNGRYAADIAEENLQADSESDSGSLYSSSSSSDVDIIVNAPSPILGESHSFTHVQETPRRQHRNFNRSRQNDKHGRPQQQQQFQAHPQYLNVAHQHFQPPQYQQFPQTPQRFSNSFVPSSTNGTTHNSRHSSFAGTNSRRNSTKPLAGSDVMTRYLEQLHHNTFVYAANILGATQDPVFYDEDNV
ncbi:unnamed protein product [Kluyveromyces dobzhanskii CBS 2104]|uniref:WGS project CCBQ000000000 data, contig 00098 n=1 Tax=Kluyveromyces dobzhanskii CBS 2104 TaxID=1427455 RepID=A0A0A8L323_9SACH|nr:unnamed protein product [Kluyveromyces dobzhanskii CBS 2104]